VIQIPANANVVVMHEPLSFRNGIDGTAAIVRLVLEQEPLSGGFFLILPWVRCQNLATKVLAMTARRLGADWEERYGYRPVLLETFVEMGRFHGTCYKAANWHMVGITQGRSKRDRFHAHDKPKRSIWVMPLVRDFRRALLAPRTPEPR
jgi:hypothetical protein